MQSSDQVTFKSKFDGMPKILWSEFIFYPRVLLIDGRVIGAPASLYFSDQGTTIVQ
jgi:hypothetical protein